MICFKGDHVTCIYVCMYCYCNIASVSANGYSITNCGKIFFPPGYLINHYDIPSSNVISIIFQ